MMIPYKLDNLRVPAQFVARAYIDKIDDGVLRVTETPAYRPPTADNFTALMCEPGAFHYFHFMEAIIWLWTVQHAYLGGAQPARIVFNMLWDNAQQNHVQRAVLAALYPGVPIGDPSWQWPQSFDNVLIYDRDSAGMRLNKIVEAALGIARPHVIDMSRKTRRAVGGFDGRMVSPRILYVTRPPPRCFSPEAESSLLACLQAYGPVTQIDFAALPWEQQVRVVAAHDVLVGVHGNGLTNALWMRPGSLVLEFFSPGARHYDYQFFAELAGLTYFGFDGMDNIFPAFSRTGEPYGHGPQNNKQVTQVPIAAVRRLLDTWMPKGSG